MENWCNQNLADMIVIRQNILTMLTRGGCKKVTKLLYYFFETTISN